LLFLGGQHGHHRLIDPCALTVPEAAHHLPLNHMLPQRPLRPVIRSLHTRHREEGEPVAQAVQHLSREPPHLPRLIRPPGGEGHRARRQAPEERQAGCGASGSEEGCRVDQGAGI